jgi:hypothetical protein
MRLWSIHPRYLDSKGLGALWREALLKIHDEATLRGYRYDRSKIASPIEEVEPIEITDGQLNFEFEILIERLERRSPEKHAELLGLRGAFSHPEPHPLFTVIEGEVGPWETSYWKRLPDAHSEP